MKPTAPRDTSSPAAPRATGVGPRLRSGKTARRDGCWRPAYFFTPVQWSKWSKQSVRALPSSIANRRPGAGRGLTNGAALHPSLVDECLVGPRPARRAVHPKRLPWQAVEGPGRWGVLSDARVTAPNPYVRSHNPETRIGLTNPCDPMLPGDGQTPDKRGGAGFPEPDRKSVV